MLIIYKWAAVRSSCDSRTIW